MADALPPSPATPVTCEASWFCCGTAWGPCASAGGGACGNCKSGSLQCAWPYTSQACFNETRPDQCGQDLIEWATQASHPGKLSAHKVEQYLGAAGVDATQRLIHLPSGLVRATRT